MDTTITSGSWKVHLGRGLAPRELQFLLSTAQGYTAKEIAKTFGVVPGTVVKRQSSHRAADIATEKYPLVRDC